jgi:hypothetical protein
LPGVSIRRVSRVLKFSRARLRARAVIAKIAPQLDEVLAGRIQHLIELRPTFGYRRLCALLRFGEGLRVNRKAVYRILKLKRLCEMHEETVWLNLIAIPEEGRRIERLRMMPREPDRRPRPMFADSNGIQRSRWGSSHGQAGVTIIGSEAFGN